MGGGSRRAGPDSEPALMVGPPQGQGSPGSLANTSWTSVGRPGPAPEPRPQPKGYYYTWGSERIQLTPSPATWPRSRVRRETPHPQTLLSP